MAWHVHRLITYQLRFIAGWIALFFGSLLPAATVAQLCTDATAPIVFQQTFGTAGNKPNLQANTSYLYVTDGCPNDGQYTVRSAVSGTCYTSSWHGVPEDHTPGDVDGNMLVMNAAYIGEIFRQPLPRLCPGATYTFSFWLLNLNIIMPPGTCGMPVPQNPTLTLVVETEDGKSLQTASTGVIQRTPGPVWHPFTFSFAAPSDTTPVRIRFMNNELGGCGNDFILDDFQLVQCSPCPSAKVFVPTAFTPNQDGVNDLLSIISSEEATVSVTVFDRWGSVIFTGNSPESHWDGTYRGQPCEPGIYVIHVTMRPKGASSDTFTQTSKVLLIR